mgnify:CR=1 FL=1
MSNNKYFKYLIVIIALIVVVVANYMNVTLYAPVESDDTSVYVL